MWLLTLRDIQYRLVRFLVVIVATGLVFALLMLMSGLADQLSNEAFHAVDGIGAAYWIGPAGASGPFTSTGTLPQSVVQQVQIERAAPVLIARSGLRLGGRVKEVIVFGHLAGRLGSPHVVEGVAPAQPTEIAVDASTKLKVGQKARVANREYLVTGLTRDETILAGLPFVFMDLTEARQALYQGRDIVSAVLADTKPVSLPDGVTAQSSQEVALDARHPLEQAIKSVNLIRVLLWIVSAMIIGGIIYLSAMERRRDFAVLKAIGAETKPLLAGLAAQGVVVAIAASLLASILQLALAPTFPLKIHVSVATLIQVPVLAVLISLVASAAGMRQVASVDPALSFA